jgi:hypothetical protein
MALCVRPSCSLGLSDRSDRGERDTLINIRFCRYVHLVVPLGQRYACPELIGPGSDRAHARKNGTIGRSDNCRGAGTGVTAS